MAKKELTPEEAKERAEKMLGLIDEVLKKPRTEDGSNVFVTGIDDEGKLITVEVPDEALASADDLAAFIEAINTPRDKKPTA